MALSLLTLTLFVSSKILRSPFGYCGTPGESSARALPCPHPVASCMFDTVAGKSYLPYMLSVATRNYPGGIKLMFASKPMLVKYRELCRKKAADNLAKMERMAQRQARPERQ